MSTDDRQFAENGPPLPDLGTRTVCILVSVVSGQLVQFDGTTLPALKDCSGALTIPEFAIKDSKVKDELTQQRTKTLFEKGHVLFCRLGAGRIPGSLRPKCIAEKVENSPLPGAFV